MIYEALPSTDAHAQTADQSVDASIRGEAAQARSFLTFLYLTLILLYDIYICI